MDLEELKLTLSELDVYESFDFINQLYLKKNIRHNREHTTIRNLDSPHYVYISVKDLPQKSKEIICKDILKGIAIFYYYVTDEYVFPLMSFFNVKGVLEGKEDTLMIYKNAIKWFTPYSHNILLEKGIQFEDY